MYVICYIDGDCVFVVTNANEEAAMTCDDFEILDECDAEDENSKDIGDNDC